MKDLTPTLPAGPFGPMTLLRLRKSEALLLASFLTGEGPMMALQDALRRELTACGQLSESNVEDIWLAGIEIRHVVEGRSDKSIDFHLPRIELDERVWLVFVLGFLRYSFDAAVEVERLPTDRLPELAGRLEEERSRRGAAIPLGGPSSPSVSPARPVRSRTDNGERET